LFVMMFPGAAPLCFSIRLPAWLNDVFLGGFAPGRRSLLGLVGSPVIAPAAGGDRMGFLCGSLDVFLGLRPVTLSAR
jgi:hypothetical protein